MEFGGICGDEGGETVGGTGGAQAAGTSRWNPTKEQIGILEGLYKQGIRTPTTEQIQQITGRLRAYGHIEGKNVFYWFQNHKARQRQKQKQENLALLSRYFYHRSRSAAAAAAAPFPSSSPDVICGPYCVAPSEVGGFFPIHPMVVLPACGTGVNKRRQRPDLTEEGTVAQGQKVHNTSLWRDNSCYDMVKGVGSDASGDCETTRKTLDLFPQHPTTGTADGSKDEITVAASPGSSEVREVGPKEHRAYFDFFSENPNH